MYSLQTPADAVELAQQVAWLGIRLEGWLVIAAVLLGPILALWAQRYSERRRLARERKLWLFRELMATRTTRISRRHVEALNYIDLEFDRAQKADVKVLDAWKMYLDDLNRPRPKDEILRATQFNESEEHFIDLIWKMGQYLGFSFDKVAIKRDAYSPIAHGEIEDDERFIREAVVELLRGRRALKTTSWLMPGPEPLQISNSVSSPGAETPPAREQPLVEEVNTKPQTARKAQGEGSG